MSDDLNKVIMSCRLTKDIVLTTLPSGTVVAETSIASNRDRKDKKDVCFCDVRCYGDKAANFAKYLSKGQPLLITGRLVFDQWEAQDGSKRSKHRITIENFTFVDSKPGSEPRETGGDSAPIDDGTPF